MLLAVKVYPAAQLMQIIGLTREQLAHPGSHIAGWIFPLILTGI